MLLVLSVLITLPSCAQKDRFSKGKTKDGKKVGIWTYKDYGGELYFSYDYDKNEILKFKDDRTKHRANIGGEWKEVDLERIALFKDGLGAIFNHLATNTGYPEKALSEGISGKVLVSFVIDTAGFARDFTILRNLSPECDAEAIRVLSTLPNSWHPAIYDGRKVEVDYRIPIVFNLNSR